MDKITFSSLFGQLLVGTDLSLKKFADSMSEENAIPYNTLKDYKFFNTVPAFESARKILNELGFIITDEDLAALLDYSRKQLSEMRKDDSKYVKRGLRINPKNIDSDFNPEKLMSYIEMRMRSLENGDKKMSFSNYIEYLIRNDLNTAFEKETD